MKEDLRKWRDIACLQIGSLNIIKTAILPKLTYKFTVIHIKVPACCFFSPKIDKLILRFISKCKGLRITSTVLRKKNKVRELVLGDFKTQCTARVVKELSPVTQQ